MKTIPVSLIVAGALSPACLNAEKPQENRAFHERQEGMQAAKREFIERWKAADKNGDGLLSMEEFSAMPRLQPIPDAQRGQLFHRLDKDGNGSIGSEELRQTGPRGDEGRERMHRLWELDSDRSGGISLDEFRSGGPFRKLPAEGVERIFNRLDTDGNGAITPEDRPRLPERPGQAGDRPRPDSSMDRGKLPHSPSREHRPEGSETDRGMPSRPEARPGEPPAYPRNFRQEGQPMRQELHGKQGFEAPRFTPRAIPEFDRNKDGGLDFEEFRTLPFLQRLGEDDQEDRFEHLDRNHDLKITPDDFLPTQERDGKDGGPSDGAE